MKNLMNDFSILFQRIYSKYKVNMLKKVYFHMVLFKKLIIINVKSMKKEPMAILLFEYFQQATNIRFAN